MLTVQTESIKKAEEKSRLCLEKRRERIASENRDRERRNSRNREKVECVQRGKSEEFRRKSRAKVQKVDEIVRRKEEAKELSRANAIRMAELRSAVRYIMSMNN